MPINYGNAEDIAKLLTEGSKGNSSGQGGSGGQSAQSSQDRGFLSSRGSISFDKRTNTLLDDRSGRVEASFFGEVLENNKNLLQVDQLVMVEAEISPDEYSGGFRVTARKVYPVAEARINAARTLELTLDMLNLPLSRIRELQTLLQQNLPTNDQKSVVMQIRCQQTHATAVLQCGETAPDALRERVRLEIRAIQIQISEP